ncbi:hypothetical protein N9I97_00540 [bacterium]|nr:hypothetical protein [bacterium]
MSGNDKIEGLTVGQLQNALVGALKKAGVGSNNQQTSSSSSSGGGGTTNFGKGVSNSVSALGGFARFLGGQSSIVENLQSQTKILPPVFSAIGMAASEFLSYLDDTQRTFQSLSKVGAGFNGDLGALRAGAANTRLPLDQFANMIGNNAQNLTALGGSVNQGAKRFSELSRVMFEDGRVIQGMSNLGYSLEESNEMLLTNASLLGRQAMLTGMSDQAVTQATLDMAQNIAVMAEISGQSAEKQKQDLVDMERDGKNVAANRRMENRGIHDASQTMTTALVSLGPLGSAAKAFAQDMNQTGVPMSDMTKNFKLMHPETAANIEAMQKVRESNMTTAQKNKEIARLSDQAKAAFAEESVGDTQLFAASVGQLNSIGASQAKVIEETRAFTEGVEKVQARMQAAGEGTVSTAEAAKIYLEEARNAVRAQTGGGAEGQAISRELNKATINLANSATEVQGAVAKNLSANTKFQQDIAIGINKSAEITRQLREEFNPGRFLGDDAGMNKILEDRNNFTELFKGVTTGNAINVTSVDVLNQGRNKQGKALGGGVLSGEAYKIGELGPETFVAGMDGAIIPNMKSMLNRMPDMAQQLQDQMATMGAPMTEAAKTAMATMPTGGSVEEKLDILNQTMLQLVNINTMHKDIGNKQIRTMRSAGNLMSGLGRA